MVCATPYHNTCKVGHNKVTDAVSLFVSTSDDVWLSESPHYIPTIHSHISQCTSLAIPTFM